MKMNEYIDKDKLILEKTKEEKHEYVFDYTSSLFF